MTRSDGGCRETEQEERGEILQNILEQFRLIFHRHHAVVLLIEPESGLIIDANIAAEQFYGYSFSSLRTMSISDINTLPPDEIAAERKCAAREERNYFIFPHRLANGEIRTVEVYSSPFTVQQNTLLLSIIHDITERKRIEFEREAALEAMKESEARYRILFEKASEGICYISTDMKLVMLNESFAHMHGYTVEEMQKMSLHDLDTPEGTRFVSERVNKLKSGETITFEADHYHKNGHTFPLEVSSSMVRAGGELLIQSFHRDITKRKESESALHKLTARVEQVREEERANIAREIHDELGQLLTAVNMNISWIASKLKEEKKLHDKLHHVRELVDSSIQTVRRIATELRPPELDEMGLGAALESYALQFEESSGIGCTIIIEPVFKLLSQSPATTVFRIFQESLTNVSRHAKATQVTMHLTLYEKTLCLEIIDNGQGITEQKLNDPKSIGILGMKERARALGGELMLSGKPGAGTTVTATIPMNHL